jgi:LuxR family maltose regulon positive regulatory protein
MVPHHERSYPGECSHAHLALAVVAIARDRPADAEANLALAGQPVCPTDEPTSVVLAALVQAQLLRSRGDLAGGQRTVRAARERLTDRPHSRELTHWLLAAEADLHTAHGDLEAARRLLSPLVESGTAPVEPLAVALARTHLHGGQPGTAVQTLPDWADSTAQRWPLGTRLDAGLLDALAARQLGDGRRAARLLERVLELAEPEGFRRPFVSGGPAVRDLLAAHLDTGTAYWPLISELIVDRDAPTPREQQVGPLVPGEPLTERELTILRYLQSILSNVEIASELSLSVNTVKTHVRNIYRKLDATRRREAVRRARELRLL